MKKFLGNKILKRILVIFVVGLFFRGLVSMGVDMGVFSWFNGYVYSMYCVPICYFLGSVWEMFVLNFKGLNLEVVKEFIEVGFKEFSRVEDKMLVGGVEGISNNNVVDPTKSNVLLHRSSGVKGSSSSMSSTSSGNRSTSVALGGLYSENGIPTRPRRVSAGLLGLYGQDNNSNRVSGVGKEGCDSVDRSRSVGREKRVDVYDGNTSDEQRCSRRSRKVVEIRDNIPLDRNGNIQKIGVRNIHEPVFNKSTTPTEGSSGNTRASCVQELGGNGIYELDGGMFSGNTDSRNIPCRPQPVELDAGRSGGNTESRYTPYRPQPTELDVGRSGGNTESRYTPYRPQPTELGVGISGGNTESRYIPYRPQPTELDAGRSNSNVVESNRYYGRRSVELDGKKVSSNNYNRRSPEYIDSVKKRELNKLYFNSNSTTSTMLGTIDGREVEQTSLCKKNYYKGFVDGVVSVNEVPKNKSKSVGFMSRIFK